MAAVVLLLSSLMIPSPAMAQAAESEEHAQAVINSTHGPLSLEVSPYPLQFEDLTPGDSVAWTVTPKLRDDLSGPLSLQIISDGPLANNDAGAHLTLRRCSEPWVQEQCASGAVLVVDSPFSRIDPAQVHNLGILSPEQGGYFRATLAMPANLPDHLQDSTATFGLGFTALGDAEHVTNEPPTSVYPSVQLPSTGTAGLLGLGGFGLLLAVAGIVMRFRKQEGTSE